MRLNLHRENGVWGVDPEVRFIQHYTEPNCPLIRTWTRPYNFSDGLLIRATMQLPPRREM